MRYSAEHKQQTREKLLHSSGALAKAGGFATTGVDGLMKAIGLTGGAFYSHFPSKSDLFTEIVRRELSHSPIALLSQAEDAGRDKLQRCLERYLSLAHLHNPETGCAIPALGAETEHWLCQIQQAWAGILDDGELAWALLAQCVGALVVARMLARKDVQEQVLDASRALVNRLLPAPAD